MSLLLSGLSVIAAVGIVLGIVWLFLDAAYQMFEVGK